MAAALELVGSESGEVLEDLLARCSCKGQEVTLHSRCKLTRWVESLVEPKVSLGRPTVGLINLISQVREDRAPRIMVLETPKVCLTSHSSRSTKKTATKGSQHCQESQKPNMQVVQGVRTPPIYDHL